MSGRLVAPVALLLLLTAPVGAQPGDAVSEARRLFADGVAAARASRWQEAHDAFARSYQAAPRQLTLFNLAGAQRNTGRLVAAQDSYRRFLEGSSPGQHDAYRKEARKQVEELGRRIPTVEVAIEGSAAGDQVELDGRPIEGDRLAAPIPVDPGPHVVLVRREGRAVARRAIKLAEGARETIRLRIPLPAAPPAPAAVAGPPRTDVVAAPARPAKRGSRGGVFRSPWFWGAAAAVAIGAGVGAAFLLRGEEDPTAGTLGTVDVP